MCVGAEAARGSGDLAPWLTAREGDEGSQSREFGAARSGGSQLLHSVGITEFFLPASFGLKPYAGRGQAGVIRVQRTCWTPEG